MISADKIRAIRSDFKQCHAKENIGMNSMNLYHDLYRCESCSDLSDPNGVAPFTNPGPAQTIPVSHFGDIDKSLIWVIFNNPKGDRSDPNVGTTPGMFGAAGRTTLSASDAQRVKERFDRYFAAKCHAFFEKWKTLLNGLSIKDEKLTFENGGICAVDLIKCPTAGSFMGFVMKPEGKKVWDNCLRAPDGNKFLLKQIEHHRPTVIIFAGTQTSVKTAWKGERNRELSSLVNQSSSVLVKTIWTLTSPKRLSVGLHNQRWKKLLDKDALNNEKKVIQSVINRWQA
jgi:hypothetical protein